MYAWIWRKLPFGVPGKVIGSLILVGAVVAALWFWGFPAAEPLLPFDDVQVGDGNAPTEMVPGQDVIPYPSTDNPDPGVSPSVAG